MLRDWDKRYPGRMKPCSAPCRTWCLRTSPMLNCSISKGFNHGSEVVNGGDLAFDREEIPMQPAGWQPEEEDAQFDELRLNVVEVK